MSKLTKLSDLCIKITDGSHYSPQGTAKGYPMLSSKDMQDYDFDFSQCKYISEDDYTRMIDNDCKPLVNDVLIIKDGNSYLQKVFVVREERECAILSSIGVLRPDTLKLDPYYLKYYLSSDFVKREVAKKYVTGSALPRIILKNFGNIEIPYIDIKSQEKVVSVLKLIDLKIENNNKINMELESMAKTIYDYWFMQFEFPNEDGKPYKSSGGKMVWNEELKREIPDGWKVANLKDIAFITMGTSPKGDSINTNGDGIVFYQGKADFGNRFPITRTYTEAPIRYAAENDILLSVRAPVGTLNIANERCCIGRGLAAIHSKCASFIFYLMLANQYKFDIYNNGGTTFGAITKEDLFGMRIVVPKEDIIDQFEKKVNCMDRKIFKGDRENQVLISLREFLLPLLMNGQVGFKD